MGSKRTFLRWKVANNVDGCEVVFHDLGEIDPSLDETECPQDELAPEKVLREQAEK